MEGLRDERFGGSGRGVENESEGWGRRMGETDGETNGEDGWGRRVGGGDNSETGSLVKKKGTKSVKGIGASVTRDLRDKEESINIITSVANFLRLWSFF